MSRVRRLSYAIAEQGRRANATKQAMRLRDSVLSILEEVNQNTSVSRRITKRSAFTVVLRSLQKTRNLPFSLREHMAIKELSTYINLAQSNKVNTLTLSNTDLLPISHPRSTRQHTLTASALRNAQSQWFADDPRITDERARIILASAFSSEVGSVEHTYYTSILSGMPSGLIPTEALLAAFGDGNSPMARSLRAQLQRRDRLGRFAYQGGGLRALVKRAGGVFSLTGRVLMDLPDGRVQIELADGRIVAVKPEKGEYIKAVLPGQSKDGFSPNPVKNVSMFDDVIDESELESFEAPNGWQKVDNAWINENWVVEIDEARNFKANNGESGAVEGKGWADILDAIDDYEKVAENQPEFKPEQEQRETKKPSKFEFNYPDGAFKIFQGRDYDPEGRQDEDSPDFTDDPVELAQRFEPSELIEALEQAVLPQDGNKNAFGYGALRFGRGDELVPAEAIHKALEEAGEDADLELAKIYDKGLGSDANEKALIDSRKAPEQVTAEMPDVAEAFERVVAENTPDVEPAAEVPQFEEEKRDTTPLPPLLQGLTENELARFMESKDHTPHLPKNFDIADDQIPVGYNKLDPAPFKNWREVTAEDEDANLPAGFSDNPVFLAQNVSKEELLKEFRRALEPGNEAPGYGAIKLRTDDGEEFVANVPGEAIRDALQLQGEDTNVLTTKIYAEAGNLVELNDEDAAEVMRKMMAGEEPYGRKPGKATEAEGEVPTAQLPNLPKAPSDKDLNDLREGLKENDYLNDGILFAKNEDNPNDIDIIDDNALAGDEPLAKIYENNVIAWRDEATRQRWEERFNDNLEQVLLAMRGDKKDRKKAVLPKKEEPAPEIIRDPSLDEIKQQQEQEAPEPVAVYKKTVPAEVPQEYEVDALGEIPDGNAEYPKPADVAPSDIGGGDGPKPPFRIRSKVKDLQPGDITVGDHFVITKIGEKVEGTNRLQIEGYYPGHVIQNTKQWIEDTEIEVIRGVDPLPEQGDLPVLSKPKMRDFGKVYKDKADNQWKLRDPDAQAAYDKAWAEYVAQAEVAKKKFADPTSPSNQPHRAIVRAADLKPGDVTTDPKKGHFVIERVFVDDATKPGFVSVEGYYPGYGTQRKEWKVDTQIDVIRNVEAPAKGEGELHRPNKVVNGKWVPDKDPAKNEEWQKKIEEAAARWNAPKDLPVVDNKEQAPEADINIPNVVVARKPKRKQAPDFPAFQGEWAAIARRAGGDWRRFREELKDKTIVFFDFETTGVKDKDGNEPWQVAAIKVRNGEIIDRVNIFMNPGRSIKDVWAGQDTDGKPNAVDADGNKLTDEFLAQQPSQADAMKQFFDWVGPDALLGAHYIQFDDEVARRMADKHGLTYAPAGLLDTKAMAKDIFKDAPEKPDGNRLGQLAEFLDVKLDNWHAADADAEAVAGLFEKLIDKGIELDAGKDLFDVDVRAAEYEKALADFEADKAKDDQAAADFAAAKAIRDALDGKEVALDNVLADAKNEPAPNPEGLDMGPVDAPLEGIERRDDGVVILDFTPNAVYPKGEMRMMPREWVLDDKNAVLLDREDARMRNILPGDFMQSKDGNIIWQVVAVRAGEENGFQPGRVRIYRRDIETGEMNVYEHWHGTRLDGVRRPINPSDLDIPEGNPNEEFVTNKKAAPESEENPEAIAGRQFRKVYELGNKTAVVKLGEVNGGIFMEAELFDADGNSIFKTDGTFRTFAGAEAEADALLKEFADGLKEKERQEAAEPEEARAKDVPISRGDIPADAYDAPETIEVENMPEGLNGQISIRETGDDKPNYEVDAVVQDADGENLAEHHSEHPSKARAEKEGRDWVNRAAEGIQNTEAPSPEEPSKKKATKPKKELPQDQKVRFSQLNEEEQAEVLRNIAEVEAMAVDMAGIRAGEVRPGDFLKHRQLGHYEKVIRVEAGKEFGMNRVILWVWNPIAGKEQPRPFEATAPLQFVRRIEGEGPAPKFPVGKPRGRARRPDIRRQADPLEQVKIREGRVAPDIDIKENRGFFNGADGEPVLKGDIVVHSDPAKAAKLGRGLVKRRIGDQVDEGKKIGGLARQGKARLDFVWVQWENEEAANAIENDGARLVVAHKLHVVNDDPNEVIENLKKKNWKGGVGKPNNRGGRNNPHGPAAKKAPEAPKAPEAAPNMDKVDAPAVQPQQDANLLSEDDVEKQFMLKGSQFVRDKGVKVLDRVENVKVGDFIMTRRGNIGRVIETTEVGDRVRIKVRYRSGMEYEYKPYRKDLQIDGLYRIPTKENPDPQAAIPKVKKPTAPVQAENNANAIDFPTAARRLALAKKNLPKIKDIYRVSEKDGIRAVNAAHKALKAGDIDRFNIYADKAKRRLVFNDKYSAFIDELQDIQNGLSGNPNLPKAIEPIKEFNGPSVEELDPVAVAEERKNNGENPVQLSPFWQEKFVKSADFWADLARSGIYGDQLKEEIRAFFADGEPKPLAALSPEARKMLAAIANNKLLDKGRSAEENAEIKNIADLALKLHAERLAFEPNVNEWGPGEALANLDIKELERVAGGGNRKGILEFNGRQWFVKRMGTGGGRMGTNRTYLVVDMETGRRYYFKQDENKAAIDGEMAGAAFFRAAGIMGAYMAMRHSSNERVVITTEVGENLALKKAPVQAHELTPDDLDFIAKGHIPQAMMFAIVDALIDNQDRHMNNFKGAQDDNKGVNVGDNGKLMLLPIDQGLGDVFQAPGQANSPFEFLNKGYGRSGIPKRLKRFIGTDAFYELLQMTGQQALQALRRDYPVGKAPEVDIIAQRLEELLAVPRADWGA